MKNIVDIYEGLLKGQEETLKYDLTEMLWDILCVNPNNENCKKGYELIEDILKKDGKISTKKPNKWGHIIPSGPKSLIQLEYSRELISNKRYPSSINIYDGKTKVYINLSPYDSFVEKHNFYLKGNPWYKFTQINRFLVYEVPDSLQPFINKISEFIKTL